MSKSTALLRALRKKFLSIFFIYPMTSSDLALQILVAGNGKLAAELTDTLSAGIDGVVAPWSERKTDSRKAVVVHAGSGRELTDILEYCRTSSSVLIELATGSTLENMTPAFPVVLCPNTNVLMLKFMHMIEKTGPLFRNMKIDVLESHQAEKSSAPGTAIKIAQSLHLASENIISIRSPEVQKMELEIPEIHLSRHAYHRIIISDRNCSLKLESRVYGTAPYADGVKQIIDVIQNKYLENRCYSVMEFVENNWL